MGDVSDNLNENCSVHFGTELEVKGSKDIVQECLHPFPYLWASLTVLICDTYLMSLLSCNSSM
jgi:hypothetical protein